MYLGKLIRLFHSTHLRNRFPCSNTGGLKARPLSYVVQIFCTLLSSDGSASHCAVCELGQHVDSAIETKKQKQKLPKAIIMTYVNRLGTLWKLQIIATKIIRPARS